MVFGGLGQERIQFNEDSVWTGEPHEYQREGAAEYLPQMRQLLYDGKQREAENLAMSQFMSDPVRQMAYQPFGNVLIEFPQHEQVADYRRDLNLDTAVTSVSYQVGETSYQRQAFVSRPDQAVVWNMSADKPGKVTFTVRLDSPHQQTTVTVHDGKYLTLTGQVRDGAIQFESRLRVDVQGGETTYGEDEIRVENADSATLTLVAATNFKRLQRRECRPGSTLRSGRQGHCRQRFRRVVESEPGGPPTVVSPRSHRLGHDRSNAAADRPATQAGGRHTRPATRFALLPVRTLPADHQLPRRLAASQPAGDLERDAAAAVG